MTRWARAGSSQRHKKIPGDATKWGEFDLQKSNKSLEKHKIKKKVSIENNKNNSYATNLPTGIEKDFQKKIRYEKQNSSIDLKDVKSNESLAKIPPGSLTAVKPSNPQDVNSLGESSHEQKFSIKKKKNKKRKAVKQNDEHDKSSEVSTTKVFEKKKGTYLEKLQKKRAEKGILLLPSKVERKLYNIKRRLREKNIPVPLIKEIIRKERRKAELNFRKNFSPSKLCFNCRQPGHILTDCPAKLTPSNHKTGICFKCGSTEHTSSRCTEKVQGFPFASCFICKEQGHISKDCPSNKHGVYPKGGRCNVCGNVNHLRKDCPTFNKKRDEESTITLQTINEDTSIDAETPESKKIKKNKIKKAKIVKF